MRRIIRSEGLGVWRKNGKHEEEKRDKWEASEGNVEASEGNEERGDKEMRK